MKKTLKIISTLTVFFSLCISTTEANYLDLKQKLFDKVQKREDLKDKVKDGRILKFGPLEDGSEDKDSEKKEEELDEKKEEENEKDKEDTSSNPHKWKKNWTDEEIIELGYIPDEILVKFKKEKIDITKEEGKIKAQGFVTENSFKIASFVMQSLEKKNKIVLSGGEKWQSIKI